MLLCAICEGTALKPCASCRGYGDASWLSKLLPAASRLSRALAERAAELRAWFDERARLAAVALDLARRLEELRKSVDPTARLGPDVVEVSCPACRGKGGECAECWATGRREFHDGTPVYERHALAQRLEKRLAEAGRPVRPIETGRPLPVEDGTETVYTKPPPLKEAPRQPAAGPMPSTVDEMIRQADALHVSGKAHLERSKTANDNAGWIEASEKALADLKQAQTLYASAQEKLDEQGLAVPKELLSKYRVNMQALVMARKQAP
jgi:hypothetical protein